MRNKCFLAIMSIFFLSGTRMQAVVCAAVKFTSPLNGQEIYLLADLPMPSPETCEIQREAIARFACEKEAVLLIKDDGDLRYAIAQTAQEPDRARLQRVQQRLTKTATRANVVSYGLKAWIENKQYNLPVANFNFKKTFSLPGLSLECIKSSLKRMLKGLKDELDEDVRNRGLNPKFWTDYKAVRDTEVLLAKHREPLAGVIAKLQELYVHQLIKQHIRRPLIICADPDEIDDIAIWLEQKRFAADKNTRERVLILGDQWTEAVNEYYEKKTDRITLKSPDILDLSLFFNPVSSESAGEQSHEEIVSSASAAASSVSVSPAENTEKPTIDKSSISWQKPAAIVCGAAAVVAGCIWAYQSGLFENVCSNLRSFWGW